MAGGTEAAKGSAMGLPEDGAVMRVNACQDVFPERTQLPAHRSAGQTLHKFHFDKWFNIGR